MKLIVHVGPPKTGTTALQRALFRTRAGLLQHSVLYPDPKVRKAYNHGQLCYLFRPFSQAPRGMRQRGKAEYVRRGKRLADEVLSQTRSHDPDLLILSSEWFARLHQAEAPDRFLDFLDSLGADSLEFLMYARRPSEFFLSASQQRLRAASLFEPIYPWNPTELIDGIKAIAPHHRVTARTFDRTVMIGGSIISDFAALYLPHCPDLLNQTQTSRQSNESFSPESMVILQDFRRTFFADSEDVFNERTRRVMRKLQKLDAQDGHPRPKLRPEWKDYLDYGDARALQLRDMHGITFSDFDYGRLERQDFVPRPDGPGDAADVVIISPTRLRQMVGSLDGTFWSPRRSSAAWLRDLSDRVGRSVDSPRPLWRRI